MYEWYETFTKIVYIYFYSLFFSVMFSFFVSYKLASYSVNVSILFLTIKGELHPKPELSMFFELSKIINACLKNDISIARIVISVR